MGPILFYGGILAMAIAVVLGIVALIFWKLKANKLRRCFDEEYGQKKEPLE